MKMKNAFPRVLVVVVVLFLAACSANKKETTESDQAETPKSAEASVPADVQPFDNVDASVKSQLNGFLVDYFSLNQALIEDNQDGAKAAAKKLSETIKKFDMSKLVGDQMDFYHVQLAKLNTGLSGIDKSTDIEETRMELAAVSEAMYALAKAYHPSESKLYYQFCPMARNGEGANWLSSTEEIINPYMGQRMLKCGRTEETIK